MREQAIEANRPPLDWLSFFLADVRGGIGPFLADQYALVSIQLLDGVGAGIFGALFPVLIADLKRGTGRYNLALGASATCCGVCAALSNGVAGWIVDRAGFDAAFLFRAGCAAAAAGVFWIGVPETAHRPKPEARQPLRQT